MWKFREIKIYEIIMEKGKFSGKVNSRNLLFTNYLPLLENYTCIRVPWLVEKSCKGMSMYIQMNNTHFTLIVIDHGLFGTTFKLYINDYWSASTPSTALCGVSRHRHPPPVRNLETIFRTCLWIWRQSPCEACLGYYPPGFIKYFGVIQEWEKNNLEIIISCTFMKIWYI